VPVPLANLDVGGVRGPGAPSRDSVIDTLEASVRPANPNLASVIGSVSRGLANVLPFQQGETISESLSITTGESIAEVHARLSLPFLRVPTVGKAITRALTNEFRAVAARGQPAILGRTREIYEAALEKIEDLPAFQGGKPVSRDLRTEARLKELLTNLRTAEILAERVREAP